MLDAGDKKWFQEQLADFASKKELGAMRDSLDILRNKLATSALEKYNFKSEIEAIRASNIRIEEMAEKILAVAENHTGRIADLELENKAGAETMRRHTVKIEALVKSTKTALPE